MINRSLSRLAYFLLFLLAGGLPAFGRTGAGSVHGFEHGSAPPPGGLDHLAATIAVGLFAG